MRARWMLLSIASLLIVIPTLGLIGLFSYANSETGRHFIEQEAETQSGGTVRISGLTGSLPGQISAARIELTDSAGVWAIIEDAALDWTPAALLRGKASIRSLTARHVTLLRQPVADDSASSGKSELPARVALRHFQIDRLDLAEPVAGTAASLTISGAADLASLWHSRADLVAKRLDGEGDYILHALLDGDGSQIDLTAAEPAHGLLANLAGLPDLGRLELKASMAGPPNAEKVAFHLRAGPLTGEGHGTADFKGRHLDLDLAAQSPAMTPRPDLSWQAARLEAHVHGAFDTPEAEGHLTILGIASGGSGLDRTEADLNGKDGKLGVTARLIGLHPEGVPPALLGKEPVEVKAEATLTGKELPVTFSLSHPLIRAQGKTALTEGALSSIEATLPDLAALAPLTGVDLHGHAMLKGQISGSGKVSLEGRIEEERELLHLTADGTVADKIDLHWSADAPDVAKLGAPVSGAIAAKGSMAGTFKQFRAAAEAQGRLADSPLTLSVTFAQGADGANKIAIERGRWKSVEAGGTLDLSKKKDRALGALQAKIGDLGDFSPFAGVPLTGSAEAKLEMTLGKTPRAVIHAEVKQVTWPEGGLGHLTAEGSIEDPLDHPAASLRLVAEDIHAAGFTGKALLAAEGPETALKLSLSTDLQGPQGPATFSFESMAALPRKNLQVTSLQAAYAGETAHLLAPAVIAYGGPVKISGMRLGVGPAELTIDGQAAPQLALDLSIKKADLAYLQRAVPSFTAQGILSGEAHLRGDLSAPEGDVHVTGHDLRWGASSRLSLDAQAQLQGAAAHVDVHLDSGKSGTLTIAGTAPLQSGGKLDLRAKGGVELAILDSLLAANGREARGKVILDAGITGSVNDPKIIGGAELQGVSFQDYAQGIHFSDIGGKLQADNGVVRLSGVSGKAGVGKFTLEGTIGALQPGTPLDLTLSGRKIRPLASDLLTADMDADLKLNGAVATGLWLAGKVKISRAEINIPDNLPSSVATLKVKKKGAAPPPLQENGPKIALDVSIDAPEQIFVRGRGIDAEMGGKIHAGGSADDPQVDGGFDLRHGTYSLAGQTMSVTRGRITVDGGGPGGSLDPALDLTIESASNGIDATLAVTGYADAPVIKLSSTPDLPQDEILARLLFNESVAQLTPLQMASIAQAVASMSGVGGGFDPLALLRKHLGIDRLSVSNSATNADGSSNTMVEAGKYVANGVYVGTRQGLNGGTQARVQVDLTRHLKLDTLLGTGGGTPATGTTIENDPGSSIGLTYQFDY
jgi:translocation and assembly module TamB